MAALLSNISKRVFMRGDVLCRLSNELVFNL
jgi:hypothetical protein